MPSCPRRAARSGRAPKLWKLQQMPNCTQYLIEYSICTSVVRDMLINISPTCTKSTPATQGYLRVGLCHGAGQLARYTCSTGLYVCLVFVRVLVFSFSVGMIPGAELDGLGESFFLGLDANSAICYGAVQIRFLGLDAELVGFCSRMRQSSECDAVAGWPVLVLAGAAICASSHCAEMGARLPR